MAMQRVNKEYGGSDGDNGSGGRNGCAQNGETKSTYRVKRRVLWMKENNEHQQFWHIPMVRKPGKASRNGMCNIAHAHDEFRPW